MLKGLEAAEVKLSYAKANNDVFRIDSNYFQKQYLTEEAVLRRKAGRHLLETGAEVRSFGAYSLNNEVDYLEAGVPFVRGVNMKGGRVNFADMQYISEKAHALLWKSAVKKGMVLLSMSGTIGDVAIATSHWPYPVNSNQDIAKIDTKGAVNPFVLYSFLLSRFGQNYLKREARGSVQQHVFLSQIEQLEIPVFGNDLQLALQKTIESSEKNQIAADDAVKKAETLLLHSLGLDAWLPPEALTYIRDCSDVFVSERLDAQHFQPRFKALINFIDATGQSELLGRCVSVNQRGRQPLYADKGLPVVNSKHVLRGEVRLDSDNRIAVQGDDDLLIHHGDVLMNGTGVGTIGRASPFLHTSLALPDNHVTVLRPRIDLDAVYLSVYLNSMAGQWQVEQRLRGSSGQIELYPSDISQFKIWLAPTKIQAEIRRAVELGFTQKQRAAQFLDAAKRTVEIAIEDSEAAALAHLTAITA